MITTHNIPNHPSLSSDIPFGQGAQQGVLHVSSSLEPATEVHYWITTIQAIATFKANLLTDGQDTFYFTPFTSKSAWETLRPAAPLFHKDVLFTPSEQQQLDPASVPISQHYESLDSASESAQQQAPTAPRKSANAKPFSLPPPPHSPFRSSSAQSQAPPLQQPHTSAPAPAPGTAPVPAPSSMTSWFS